MNHARHLPTAARLLLALALVLLPLNIMVGGGHGVAAAKSFNAALSQHGGGHEHGQTEIDHCHATTGNCGPVAPAIATDAGNLLTSAARPSRIGHGGARLIGLRPLPLLPPPVVA